MCARERGAGAGGAAKGDGRNGQYLDAAGSMTRREFLRLTGVAAGFVGSLGVGLGGIFAGCNGEQQSANTTATIRSGQTVPSLARATTTTVSVGPLKGREIKIGVVSAKTGHLGLWGKADDWWMDFAVEAVGEGVLCGDGKLHRFVFLTEDSRSDSRYAGRMAAHLISKRGVDLIMCSGGATVVNPVADQAEALGCPCLCSFVQWRQFIFDRGGSMDKPFTWTYAHAIGLEDIAANFVAVWNRLQTNKKVGLVIADDAGGRLWGDENVGLPPVAAAAGYECVQPGLYSVGSLDYSPWITEFKKNGCEICSGAMSTSDFITFWRQCLELEYSPKMVTMGEALLLPHAVDAIGDSICRATAESLWQPEWPYRDSLTGKTGRELAIDYMSKVGDQWIAPIAQYAKFEWAADVFKRVRNIDNPREIITRVASTILRTCLGPIDFTAPVEAGDVNRSKRPAPNVYKAPVGAVQWVPGETFRYEPRLVAAVNSPDLPVSASVEPMH